MRVPRLVLLLACAGLVACAYYLTLFTNWGHVYRGASYPRAVVVHVATVLAAFACLEVMRSERSMPIRALAGALGGPLVLVTLARLGYSLHRYFSA